MFRTRSSALFCKLGNPNPIIYQFSFSNVLYDNSKRIMFCYTFSIRLTVFHAGLLTFLNPSDIHLVKCEPIRKWGLFWESHVSSHSPRHPGEGCKSCCPLVMTARELGAAWGKERLLSRSPPFSSLPLFSVPQPASLSLSACARLLCHPQGCVWRRPSVDPFVSCFAYCATASLQLMIRPGLSPSHPLGSCQQALGGRSGGSGWGEGGGARGFALCSLWFPQTKRKWQLGNGSSDTRAAGADRCLSKVNEIVLTPVKKSINLILHCWYPNYPSFPTRTWTQSLWLREAQTMK